MATDATTTYAQGDFLPRSPRLSFAGARERLLTALALFLGTLALYLCTPTRLNTFDAVSYAHQIAHLYPRTHDAHWLFHPHHLLFNAAGYVLWRTCQLFGYVGGPLALLQTANAILGACGVSLFYLTLRRVLHRSRTLPLLMAAGLALTFGYWTCATDGRVNMPSTTLLLGAVLCLAGLLERPTVKRAAVLGALCGGAVLFHQSAALFVPAALLGTCLAPQNPMLLPAAVKRERMRQMLAFVGTTAGVVCVPYLVVGTLSLHLYTPSAFHTWSARYSELGWWWDFRVWHNLRLDAFALRHAAFVEPAGSHGTFHVGRHVSANVSILYWLTLAGWFVALLAFCRALPLLWRSHHRALMSVCALWVVLYGAFFTVWSPGYFVFWVPVLVPVSVLLALSLAHERARRGVLVNVLAGAWIVLYAVLNLHSGIAPHAQAGASPFQKAARDIRVHTLPGDVVLMAGAGDGAQCEVDIPYFANRDAVSLHTLITRAHEDSGSATLAAQGQMNAALLAGHNVYALDELWHNRRTWDALSHRHTAWTRADVATLVAPYSRHLAWTGPRGPVWQLVPLGK